MESFAPEFAQYWLSGQAAAAGESQRDRPDDDAVAQQAALQALAEFDRILLGDVQIELYLSAPAEKLAVSSDDKS